MSPLIIECLRVRTRVADIQQLHEAIKTGDAIDANDFADIDLQHWTVKGDNPLHSAAECGRAETFKAFRNNVC